MSRTVLCLTAALAALGCQNSAWNNPYAAFGPATVPAAAMQTTPQPGYYQPPAATPTLSSTLPPIVTPPDAGTKPSPSGGTIRSVISAAPIPARPSAASPIISTPAPATSSFSTNTSNSGEEAIRIVEAAPATAGRSLSPASPKPSFSTAITEPKAPAVVAANPQASGAATLKTIPAPGVLFDPSSTSPPSPAAAPPASLDRTRGFSTPAPSNAAPAVPKNRVMSVPSIRRDSAVSPATYLEPASEATGEWKAR